MDSLVDSLTNAISQIGFPIVVSGALFWYMNKTNDTHKAEIDKLSEAVNNNTKVVEQLVERFRGEE